MFGTQETKKIVAAVLAAGAASSAGPGADSATYLTAYRETLLGLDKLEDDIERERSTGAMARLNERRAAGLVL